MANADRAIEIPGLQMDTTGGGAIQNTAYSEWIKLRDSATGGTVSNSNTVMSALITDGIINVTNCSTITLWIQPTLGSLTSIDFVVHFTDASNVLFFTTVSLLNAIATSGGASLLGASVTVYRVTGDVDLAIIVPNPGGTRCRIQVNSVGTVTNSLLGLWISRGFGSQASIIPQNPIP